MIVLQLLAAVPCALSLTERDNKYVALHVVVLAGGVLLVRERNGLAAASGAEPGPARCEWPVRASSGYPLSRGRAFLLKNSQHDDLIDTAALLEVIGRAERLPADRPSHERGESAFSAPSDKGVVWAPTEHNQAALRSFIRNNEKPTANSALTLACDRPYPLALDGDVAAFAVPRAKWDSPVQTTTAIKR